jgi:hypothetical protein
MRGMAKVLGRVLANAAISTVRQNRLGIRKDPKKKGKKAKVPVTWNSSAPAPMHTNVRAHANRLTCAAGSRQEGKGSTV